jgi:hypothetical protein
MRPLTEKMQRMFDAVKKTGEARRQINFDTWQVGDQHFHRFTGDALVKRGLLEHFVGEHDGNHYDRFKIADDE